MKLKFVDGGFNLNYIKIYKKGTKAPVAASDDDTFADLSNYPENDLSKAEVIDVTSEANVDGKASNEIDKDNNTRWESKAEDPQSLTIDLKENKEIGGSKLYWEGAYAKKYEIQVSSDNTNWKTMFTQNKGIGGQKNGDSNRSTGLESISFDNAVNGRYVRIKCIERGTGYGNSLYEIRLFGKGEEQGGVTEPEQPTQPAEPDTPDGNLALNKEVSSSAPEGENVVAANAFDGNDGTRWSSKFEDDAWISVDLGKTYTV